MPPKRMSSGPLLNQKSGLSNPTSSETGYNTASHVGLQSDPSLPSSSLQTVLLPPLASKISPPSNGTTTGPYPVRSAPTYVQAQDSNSQTASQSGQPQSATLSTKTPFTSFDRETNPTAEPRYSQAIDSIFNSSTAINLSKEKERASFFGKPRTKFVNKQVVGARGTLEGHTNSVHTIVFSPDGKLVASGSHDRTVQLWDSATGLARRTLEGHTGGVGTIAFSPDGKLVASGSYDKTVRLWDSATGEAWRTLEGHTNGVGTIVFSPDGKLVASGSYDKTVRLWDSATGEARGTLEDHTNWVVSVAFSPDGKLVASGSYDGTVRLWEQK